MIVGVRSYKIGEVDRLGNESKWVILGICGSGWVDLELFLSISSLLVTND